MPLEHPRRQKGDSFRRSTMAIPRRARRRSAMVIEAQSESVMSERVARLKASILDTPVVHDTERAMSERVARLKASIVDAPVVHDTERLKFLMEVYRETDGESPIMRRAKVFDR